MVERKTAGLYFGCEKTAEEIVWGIQLMEDVKNNAVKETIIDLQKTVRDRKEMQLKAGLRMLKNGTPSLNARQRNEMIEAISATNAEPFDGALSYQEYLFNLGSDILSRDSYQNQEARGR